MMTRQREGKVALAPGGSGWIKIDLEPGTSAAFSLLVDELHRPTSTGFRPDHPVDRRLKKGM